MEGKLIVVWGMHRSGTSLIARSLRVFGAELGSNLFPPDQGNARGYFEDRDLMRLDNCMLRELGMDWHTLSPVTPEHVYTLKNAGYLARAAAFLRQKMAAAPVVALKDPRMTRLAPFWNEVFDDLGITPLSIISWRHPLAVAGSLRKRAMTWRQPGPVADETYGMLLWLGYTSASLLYTARWPRALVGYETFLANPAKLLREIGSWLGLEVNENELQAFCAEFVDASLNHNAASLHLDCGFLPDKLTRMLELLQSAESLECPLYDGGMWPHKDDGLAVAMLLDMANTKIRNDEKQIDSQRAQLAALADRFRQLAKFADSRINRT